MRAYLFGAGSSRGTLGTTCPTAAKFGEQLAKWPGQFPNLDRVVAHLDRKCSDLTLEEIWTWIDYYYKLAQPTGGALPWTDWIPEAELDLKRALLRVYGRSLEEASDKLPRTKYTLADLLCQVEAGDVLISFKYDTLGERLAQRLTFDLQVFHHELRNDVVNFAKPHGSTSWCLNHRLKSVTYCHPDGAPLLDSILEGDVSIHKTPLLLGTVPIKSELISEVQGWYSVPEVYRVVMAQWKAIIEAIRQAEELIVVGYSFPKEDQYGRFLFQEAARARETPIKIVFYEKHDKSSCDSYESAREAFLFKVSSFECRGEVKPP